MATQSELTEKLKVFSQNINTSDWVSW